MSLLTDLIALDLGWNELSGELPSFLGSLSGLAFMDLLGIDLAGGLPAWTCHRIGLVELFLHRFFLLSDGARLVGQFHRQSKQQETSSVFILPVLL